MFVSRDSHVLRTPLWAGGSKLYDNAFIRTVIWDLGNDGNVSKYDSLTDVYLCAVVESSKQTCNTFPPVLHAGTILR